MNDSATYADGTEVRPGDAAVRAEGLTPVLVIDVLGNNPPGVLFEDGDTGARHVYQPLDGELILVERKSADYRSAGVAWLRHHAETGDRECQSALGWLYARGAGVARDDALACEWFARAAASGEPTAQYGLACRYEQGLGIEKNLSEAVRWYVAASNQDVAPAMCNLADKFEHGTGVQQDLARAFQLYQMAATRGVAAAMFGLSNLYRDGRGVARNEQLAAHWLERARRAGYPQ